MIRPMNFKDPVISLRNVSKVFGHTKAVDEVTLDIYPGELLTLLGPSGCGKTTLLRLIAGFEKADRGDIYLGGDRVNDIPPHKRDVNTVFQNYALFPHMNVFNNIAFGLKLQKKGEDEIERDVSSILDLVKLPGFQNRNIHQLSGGQQQRVAFARALVNKPLVLLLDEPLSALDYRLRKEMQIELKHIQRKLGITFVFVTHDQEEAITISDRIVVMNSGRIEQMGTPKSIYEDPSNMFVAKFIGEINEFDGEIQETQGTSMDVRLNGTVFRLSNKKDFKSGQKIKVLLRPEDIQVLKKKEDCEEETLEGVVREMIYKGTTVDLFIDLKMGKTVLATQFFNEDAEDIRYESGERVFIHWIKGWEVLLRDS